ncbi:MAG: glutamate--tRNA ligase [Chloroflexi bacterium]|nr:glutamate--tRNA ligase [Chloroflexota bacterium]
MTQRVRVRYAPSPTGDPHVGNIRTALFNWLYARHTGGTFILRIEDTDRSRSVEGALEAIFASLEWLGLDWDEGPRVGGPHAPYVQSERLPLYQEAVQTLLQQGHAYTCYCTPEELAEMRKAQQQRGESPGYNRRCRTLSDAQRGEKESAGLGHVVRFMVPTEGAPITTHDMVRGDVKVSPSTLDDFVILKSDGFPTYHLANVVDDHEMEITHVLRGDEWLPSAPRHLLLYRALGYEPPAFAHLPIILGPDRAKLAKRHGAAALLDYRAMGYLPDALGNFLALLGWSLDDKTEIMSRAELVSHFTPERILKSPAVFNIEKLTWMNGLYIRQLSEEALAEHLKAALDDLRSSHASPKEMPDLIDPQYIRAAVPLVQDRLKTLNGEDVWDLYSFFFVETPSYRVTPPVPKGMDGPTTRAALEATREALLQLDRFDADGLEGVLRPLAESLGLKTGQLFGAIRLAVTGRADAPPLFDTLAVLGRERVAYRLGHALDLLADEKS